MSFLDKLFERDDEDDDMTEAEAERLKKKLMKLAKTEIRISYSRPAAPLSACGSKLGGKPAVPDNFIWPEYEGKEYCDDEARLRPLSFMAQINLRDIAAYDTEALLPKTGVLSFFYDLVTMRWGFDPADKGSARVYYFPEEEKLSLRDIPDSLDEEAAVPELAVAFEPHISIPDFDSYPDGSLKCDSDEYDDCREECGYEYDELGDVTKLLGYPDVIQAPMEEECESVTRGYRCGGPEDYAKISDAEKRDIKKNAKEWTLLFQMGTIAADETEIMFGDCGHIYFWIKKSDLKACNFDNIRLILQCG